VDRIDGVDGRFDEVEVGVVVILTLLLVYVYEHESKQSSENVFCQHGILINWIHNPSFPYPIVVIMIPMHISAFIWMYMPDA